MKFSAILKTCVKRKKIKNIIPQNTGVTDLGPTGFTADVKVLRGKNEKKL
jgi:hypothetical protein